MTQLSWGIVGAGNISSQFVHDLCLNNLDSGSSTKHIVRAIGSSSIAKGHKFIESTGLKDENNEGVKPLSQSYEELFGNKEVEVVYVGTPHPCHYDQVKRALENGKHVVCEKPFTMNAREAKELIALAKEKNRFLMEAVWTRFIPVMEELKQMVFHQQSLGKINRLFVDFAYDAEIETLPPSSRVRDITLGGGALLDIGIYTITYARILLDDKLGNQATKFDIKSLLTLDDTDGVDYTSSILMRYANGKQAILTCSNYTEGKQPFLRLEGSKGTLELSASNPACPKSYRITFKDGSEPLVYVDKSEYYGFIYEANAVAADIANGKLQNEVVPWDETLLVMGVMDQVRQENGFVYPQDK